MLSSLAAIKGMNDILPPDSARWEWLEEVVRRTMRRFAFANIRTPIVEHTALFARGLGENTDVVEKEMYSFQDRNDKYGDADHLTLRPENTAGVVRAAIEHNLLYGGGQRLYYMGPMFRRERPQRGRYRQFHQIGAEALGFAGAQVDAEMILLAVALWRELGISRWRLELNSLGQPEERREHRAALIAWTKTPAAACTPTRCAFWTPKTPPCRRWWKARHGSWTIWARLRWLTFMPCRPCWMRPACPGA